MGRLCLYLHTHWDREWYLPFETMRSHLAYVVRQVLDGLSSGQLPNFYLDGQSIALVDAVALDPHLDEPLRNWLAQGKLAAGPWYVLADQMLVGGESLVRNLQIGMDTCRRFGQPAMIGYCPDTFGHTQDLPRILKGFGIDCAVVWRGVPPLSAGPAFRWSSPDGSTVVAYHLTRGYYQSAFHEQLETNKLACDLKSWLEPAAGEQVLASPYCSLLDASLHPVGCDHLGPPHGIEEKLEELRQHWSGNGEQSASLEIVRLADFLAELSALYSAGTAKLEQVCGELRDNSWARKYAFAYLLPAVLSTRLYLKRENRLAETRLLRLSEPLSALLYLNGVMSYPACELDHAWRLLLTNHPHDSICGCSIDQVHDEMQMRTRQLNQTLDALETRSRELLAGEAPGKKELSPRDPAFGCDSLLVANLSTRPLSGPVRISWASAPELPPARKGPRLQTLDRTLREELFGGRELVPYYKEVALNEAWVWAENVPPLGFKQCDWPVSSSAGNMPPPVNVSAGRVDNGALQVEVAGDGSLQVSILAGGAVLSSYNLGHKIRDVGDGGDTYNFDPLPQDLPLYATVKSVKMGGRGPLVGSLLVTYELAIPESAEGENGSAPPAVRSRRLVKHLITTEITLKRGVPVVFFDTRWQNLSRDHRLEVMFDTGKPVQTTSSENHFSTVARTHSQKPEVLPVEPGYEAQPDRFPCQRFFTANQQIFLNCGLPEYAVEGSAVCVTLLRAVSLLSRGRIRSRGGGAGPHLPVPGANCLGPNQASYGWAPLDVRAWPAGKVLTEDQMQPADELSLAYQLSEQFEGRLWATLVRGKKESLSGSFISVDNPSVVLSSLAADGEGRLVLRLLNVTAGQQSARLHLGFHCHAVEQCSLSGNAERQLSGTAFTGPDSEPAATVVPLAFGVNELITLRLQLPSATP